jgi:hypothetical protein
MNSKSILVAAIVLAFFCVSVPSHMSAQKAAQSHMVVVYDSYHDTSLPAREYSMEVPQGRAPREVEHPRPRRILAGAAFPVADLAEQSYVAPPVSAVIGLNFEGIPNSANGKALEGIPSDDNLAVGATQVVETINTAWQVYDKATGKSVFGPQQISALFTGVPGLCGQGQTFFWTDPVVLYDQMANRWIISQIAADNSFETGNECIAVSESSDAAGKYHRYIFKFGNNVLNDYDKLSVWPDAYYANYNLFGPQNFIADDACAYDRAAMLTGAKAKAVCFQSPNEFSFLPSNADGATPPPAGEPSFFVDLFSSTSLHLYRFSCGLHQSRQVEVHGANHDSSEGLHHGLRRGSLYSAAGNKTATGFPGRSADVPLGLSEPWRPRIAAGKPFSDDQQGGVGRTLV